MRRPLVWILVIGLLALDWAALHDIARGEEDLWAEYVIVAVSVDTGGVGPSDQRMRGGLRRDRPAARH
jgi:hypothetical protein